MTTEAIMHWYLVTFTCQGNVIEHGWMIALTDGELIEYARIMGYGIDIIYLGRANMRAVTPEILH